MSTVAPLRARLGTGALVLAALALGQWLNTNLPEGPEVSRAFERRAAVGDVVELRSMSVEVTGVRGAEIVQAPASDPFLSPGLTLVVEVDVTARKVPGGIGWAELRSGAVTTAVPGSSSRGSIDCPVTPARITTSCVLTVESLPEALPGSRLALARGFEAADTRYDDMAVIDLGITEADVAEWRDAEPVLLPQSGIAGLEP